MLCFCGLATLGLMIVVLYHINYTASPSFGLTRLLSYPYVKRPSDKVAGSVGWPDSVEPAKSLPPNERDHPTAPHHAAIRIQSNRSALIRRLLFCSRISPKKKKMKRTVQILRVLRCGWCCCCYYSALYSQLLSPLLFAVAAAEETTVVSPNRCSNNNGNSDLKNKETTGSSSNTNKNAVGNKGEVIILSAVDGTLAGISRSSGRLLWKQQQQQQQSRNENDNETTSSSSSSSLESNIDSNLNSKKKNSS